MNFENLEIFLTFVFLIHIIIMLLRVRSKVGIWRISDLQDSCTMMEIKEWIANHHDIPMDAQRLMKTPKEIPFQDSLSLKQLQLTHGDLIHLEFDFEYKLEKRKKKITSDGSISNVTYSEDTSSSGFRPGLKSLRDMKMHWTISELMIMNAQFEFKIQRQKESHCNAVSIDTNSCNHFQTYLRTFAFQQSRCGWLYGTISEENKVVVECIYEPPQQGNMNGFEVFDDPMNEKADAIAKCLGLEKVGWIFSHPVSYFKL